jgi:kynurenine formamidase
VPDVIELGHPLDLTVPHSLTAVPYQHHLTSWHAPFSGSVDTIDAETVTGATDAIALGCHTGTHIDSLSHISRGGRLYDGTDIRDPGRQSDDGGVRLSQGRELRPVVARAVLLDFPALRNVDTIAADSQLTPDDLDDCAQWAGVDIGVGDAVLIRTGWDGLAEDLQAFIAMPCPGPELAAAQYLAARHVSVVGSDTMPFEAAPGNLPLAVHGVLIADHGIQIMEMLDLRELSRRQVYEFTLVVAPLRIAGGTGSPVNPLAVLDWNLSTSAR